MSRISIIRPVVPAVPAHGFFTTDHQGNSLVPDDVEGHAADLGDDLPRSDGEGDGEKNKDVQEARAEPIHESPLLFG